MRDLSDGDIEMGICHETTTEQDFAALRKFGLMYINDLANDIETPVTKKFDNFITDRQKTIIKENFPKEKTADDITVSYDQMINLHDAIVNGLHYPELNVEDNEVDFEEVVDFMMKLRKIFKWDIYEKDTLGKPGNKRLDSVIRWYSTILLRWIRGNGLQAIVSSAIKFKEDNPDTGVWIGKYKIFERYDFSKYHKNFVIGESLSVVENVLLFSISNYFRKFSLEYKAIHNLDRFENDWYEYVEYGTTNPDTIFLQQVGFTRESSLYIQKPTNYEKYIVEIEGKKKIKRSIFDCDNMSVKNDVMYIQYNIPDLFVD